VLDYVLNVLLRAISFSLEFRDGQVFGTHRYCVGHMGCAVAKVK
jgi:hypothetical protein